LADYEPVEQVAHRGQVRHAGVGAPRKKVGDGAAGARVAQTPGEEFQKSQAGLFAGGDDERRQDGPRWRRGRAGAFSPRLSRHS
jgi:hypothetical protein